MKIGEINEIISHILLEKVRKVVERTKTRKVFGLDGVNAKIIKSSDEERIEILEKIFKRIYT